MIEYLNHILHLTDKKNFSYMDVYQCSKCMIILLKNKYNNGEEETQFMIMPTFEILELSCDEVIIKNIIE